MVLQDAGSNLGSGKHSLRTNSMVGITTDASLLTNTKLEILDIMFLKTISVSTK